MGHDQDRVSCVKEVENIPHMPLALCAVCVGNVQLEADGVRLTQVVALCQDLSGHLEAPADVGVVRLRHRQLAYGNMRSVDRATHTGHSKLQQQLR